MDPSAGVNLLDRIVTYVIDPAVKVVFTLGLFMFFWGFIEFLWELKDGKVTEDGKNHMVYGLVGMLIMVSVYGIISLVMNTFGIDPDVATDVSRLDSVNPGVNFFSN